MDRKPRSDSKLDSLPPARQELLAEWLTIENLSYADAKARVAEQFGITTSVSALQSFFSRFAAPWKYARAKGEADQFAELMEGKFDEASIKKARQLAFESMTGPRPDLKAAKSLLKIVGDSAKQKLAAEKLALDARKVAILEAKAAIADKAKGIVQDEAISEEEKSARLRSLFGMG